MSEVKFEVKNTTPPKHIYDRCVKDFGADFMKGTTFVYGTTIYCVKEPSHDIIAHEVVHIDQQRRFKSPEDWWKKYFEDEEFRLEQEVEAYREQYRHLVKHCSRDYRRFKLKVMVNSLSGKIYGNLVSKEEAKKLIIE